MVGMTDVGRISALTVLGMENGRAITMRSVPPCTRLVIMKKGGLKGADWCLALVRWCLLLV